jgi:hypothetical protein
MIKAGHKLVLNDRGDAVLGLVCPRHLLSAAYASLLSTRRRRRAVTSCGLRALPCVGVPCVISYIYMHLPIMKCNYIISDIGVLGPLRRRESPLCPSVI